MPRIQAFLHRTLPAIWQSRNWAACLLWPLSLLYGAVWRSKQRRALRQPAAPLPIPVLVVGNVIAGGAGKTPTTIAVVQHFQSLGVAVGVISRGYGRRSDAPECMAVAASSAAADVGDEPLLIHRRTAAPVAVCAKRVQAAHALLQQHPQTQLLICDDGLQHLALPRDGEICVMDERGIGNGWLLPAGPLREPWPRRTTLLLHTAPVASRTYAPTLPAGQAAYSATRQLASYAIQANGQSTPLGDWAASQQPVVALAGIALPERFFTMLAATGLHLHACHALPDHASASAMQALASTLQTSGMPILCTEKDAVKLWPVFPHIWAVPLELAPEAAFFEALQQWWTKIQQQRRT